VTSALFSVEGPVPYASACRSGTVLRAKLEELEAQMALRATLSRPLPASGGFDSLCIRREVIWWDDNLRSEACL